MADPDSATDPVTDPVTDADADLRVRTADVLLRSLGTLSTAATGRMESDVSWFRDLAAEDRSWVGVIIQAGIRSFVDWWRTGGETEPADTTLATAVFGAAPRALAGVITLQQTVDLVRLAIDVVEEHLDLLLGGTDSGAVHAALLHYGRELAFATARVYARAAELRGAWDARLEALVVDSVVRGDADAEVLSRASALGWGATRRGRGGAGGPTGRAAGDVCVVVGDVPGDGSAPELVAHLRRQAGDVATDVLGAIQGHRLVVVLGGVTSPLAAAAALADHLGPGPVVVGPVVGDLSSAYQSAREAVAGYAVAAAWPEAPRPVHALDLLPERLLAGDRSAADHLVRRVHDPLTEHRSALVATLTAYFAEGASVEATARRLFVHPNTVRYRLAQVADVTGCTPTDPRDAFTLQIALTVGRQRTAGLTSE
ncbi:helix-turn-helix domain-containing protein [Nocardioides zeae]|uniref:Helix-turn-helix domain-containing protein n=1 Tax=Nocardioides imazamoxiresistens TaxID=3231893 RepID=A0ABU3Q1Y7_9ACTN|nr:helix-turn-helix domain-containing protein [Nocardioides zeae]MDT9595047.1 helix-turn-helix domain-containing protein [Nocardioides zeae]